MPGGGSAWLTRAAFGLSLALVLARATMLEALRDPLDVAPGTQPVPRGAGPGTSLVLDLLAWVPALLVLARGTIDRTFRLQLSWGHGLLGALALLAVVSTAWADDKFAALVSGFHWLSAAVFLWSASQLVRSWSRLRLVAGACLALLLVYGAQTLNYRLVELPELRRDWRENGPGHLRERGIEPGSLAARQFENKILRGEVIGFAASSNTVAAVTVLLVVVTIGAAVQRLADRDGAPAVVLPGIGLLLGAYIIIMADSKTAYVTPVLACGILAALAVAGDRLARHARAAYFAGIAVVAVGAAAVIGHGLYHGSLVIDSMTFRWRYWVGAAKLVAAHPLLGVGWDNFGLHYPAVRLPVAAEEVRDPHNFAVRFFAELGIVGGMLSIGWMLRLWWELTRPGTLHAHAHGAAVGSPRRALPVLVPLAAAATLLSIGAFVDFGFATAGGAAGSAYVFLRVLERCAGGLIVLAGIAAAAVRSLREPVLDDRPAPWVLYGLVASLGVFLLHNLVDFSMFEVGPMFLFALLAGSALGVRQAGHEDANAPSPARAKPRLAALACATVLWLGAAGALALPVLSAEERAYVGDQHLRRGAPAPAAEAYRAAAAAVPYNGDYPFRQARALYHAGAPPEVWRQAFAAAIEANPAHAGYWSARANHEAGLPQPDAGRVRADYEQALALDPANVPMRLRFAAAIEKLGAPGQARVQYERALWFNDQLEPEDAERLPPAELRQIEERIRQLNP